MILSLSDSTMPGLSSLGAADLERITGAEDVQLVRIRYQPGARAVLHVCFRKGAEAREGAIWFFAGGKSKKLQGREDSATYDPYSQALFQQFPHDHRLPALANFHAEARSLAPDLIGGKSFAPPQPIRYRPGLSATFRWQRIDGKLFYVKVLRDCDVGTLACHSRTLEETFRNTSLAISRVAGFDKELGAIAYHAAQGTPLDHALEDMKPAATEAAFDRVANALSVLWSSRITAPRVLDRDILIQRAVQAAGMISVAEPAVGELAAQQVARLQEWKAPVSLRPVHADMKLEHVFLSPECITLIDMESLSLGDPDYDLAKLEARLVTAGQTGGATPEQVRSGIAALRRHTHAHYEWFLICARLQCAKFFAQRLDPNRAEIMQKLLLPYLP